ncbi:MAG: biotin/lipoyl-binding protein, partial [Lacisediminimonas sp.]|nr:biotin/lipoyl-binding protein [Lacisediminimonas sp.]
MKRPTMTIRCSAWAILLACIGSAPAQLQAQPQQAAPAPRAAQPAAVVLPASRPAADPAPGERARGTAEDDAVKGLTRCNSDLNLGFPLTGRIAQLKVAEGSVVRRGQAMLALDNAAETLEVERRLVQWKSMAELSAAQARLATATLQASAAREVYASTQGISREEVQNREL